MNSLNQDLITAYIHAKDHNQPRRLREVFTADGRNFVLTPGMSYQVADNAEPHRSASPIGARLFIVD